MLRGYGQYGAFGDVGILRQMHDDALSPDARGDAVDQRGKFVIVVDVASRSRCCCTTISVRLADSLMRSKPAGIEGIVERIEPLAEQAVDHLRLRHRTPVSTEIVRTAPSVRKSSRPAAARPCPACPSP